MSTQLIVYPQNYDGTYNSLLIMAGEFVVDGVFFLQINGSDSYDSPVATNQLLDALQNQPPTTVNTWYRFRSTVSGTPTLPTKTGSFLTSTLNLFSTVSGSVSGVYQLISNLTPQVYYELIVDISSPTVDGVLMLAVYNGTNYVTDQLHSITPSSTQVTLTFPAVSTNITIFVNYINSTNDVIGISKISVQEQGVAPTPAYTELADGQVICDLYEDEDIPLTLSIDEFKNVAEKVQSYSKSFNLPATKRNNLIFDNVFEITRTTTGINFNPYIKTKCVLKQDGYILFDGYLRLIDIQDKEAEISYNVNLYSEVVALADTLKEKKFRDLNFDELRHPYNFDDIRDTWTLSGTPTYSNPNTSGFRDAATLKYPFVDWNHSWTLSGGQPVLPSLESVFRPFIQIKYLIERIFADSPFTFTSNFFDTNDFENLYMDFNWGTDVDPNSAEGSGIMQYEPDEPYVYATDVFTDFIWIDHTLPALAGFDSATSIFTCPAGQTNSTYNFNSRAVAWAFRNATIEFQWVKNLGLTTEQIISPSGTQTLSGSAQAVFTTPCSSWATSCGIDHIEIIDGGYYLSTPTVTIESSTGSGFIGTAVLTGTAVTSVTILSYQQGSGYHRFDQVVFDSINPTYNYNTNITVAMEPGDTLQLQWKASGNGYIRQNTSSIVNTSFGPYSHNPGAMSWGYATISFLGMTSDILLQTLRGDIGQWDFLKGIMTMFNLVSMPDPNNPNNILIEPYHNVFIEDTAGVNLLQRTIQHDWTDKVDVSEMKLTPLTDLNKKTIFKFVEDDDDYAFMNYKNSVGGHLYGSKEYDASTAYNNLPTVLDGEEEIVAEPFAATIVKPLEDIYTDLIVPVVYSYNIDDGTSEGFDNSPRIMYNNGLKHTTTGAYDVPAQNGVGAETAYQFFLQFSHLSSIPVGAGDSDFHFGECQLLMGGGTLNNLYNTYWAPYYDELYNSDTRMMTLKVNLTPADINMFAFTDKVFIKNRVFRVNKIDYKPNDLATVEFILIP